MLLHVYSFTSGGESTWHQSQHWLPVKSRISFHSSTSILGVYMHIVTLRTNLLLWRRWHFLSKLQQENFQRTWSGWSQSDVISLECVCAWCKPTFPRGFFFFFFNETLCPSIEEFTAVHIWSQLEYRQIIVTLSSCMLHALIFSWKPQPSPRARPRCDFLLSPSLSWKYAVQDVWRLAASTRLELCVVGRRPTEHIFPARHFSNTTTPELLFESNTPCSTELPY